MDSETLRQVAPSVYATRPDFKVSNAYSFLPTSEVVTALADKGFGVYGANQTQGRVGNIDYAKHTLRFRPNEGPVEYPVVGAVLPEVVLTNSHDRGSSFIVEVGLFRLACSNGLVMQTASVDAARIRHVGVSLADVLSEVDRVVSQFPMMLDRVAKFKAVTLTDAQRADFAARAIGLRWEVDKLPFPSELLLSTRRAEDNGPSLWDTLNVVQENLLRGQRHNRRIRWNGARNTQGLQSIDRDLSINRSLWAMAEEYAATV